MTEVALLKLACARMALGARLCQIASNMQSARSHRLPAIYGHGLLVLPIPKGLDYHLIQRAKAAIPQW